MDKKKKTLLITGGAWYIWSHAVVAFEQAWYNTVILDNFVNSSRDTLVWIQKILWYCPPFFECDIRDTKLLTQLFQSYEFYWVVHFAGLKAFWESTTYPYMYFDNNVTGTLTLLDVMDRFGVKNIVFSSSASVYDGSNEPPFTEDMKLGTTNPYATSKLNIEYLLKDYARQKWFHCAVLRYFNLIGAHESGYLWDFPRWNHGSLSSNIFDVVFGKKEKLYIYGDTFPTPDGTAMRDYIDVCDLVDGHISALRWCERQYEGMWDVWNLGTWKWFSVRELISATEEVVWSGIPVEIIPKRAIDLAVPISNPTKANRELGWKPKRQLVNSIQNAYSFLLHKRKREWHEKKYRVVHFLPYFPPHPGWVEMYAKEWAENYGKRGWEVLIVTFSWWQTLKNRTQDGYSIIVLPAFDIVHSFPFPMFWMPSFWLGLYQIRKWKPQILHTHTRFFLSSFLGWIIGKILGIPWIHIEHGSGFVVSSNKLIAKVSRWYDATIGKWVLQSADEVIAVSEACEHFVRDNFSVKNIRTVYRWINATSIATKPDSEYVTIGFVGRLVDLKGIHVLIEAFSQLITLNPSWKPLRLKVVWTWPEMKKLIRLVESYGLTNSVFFLWQLDSSMVRSAFLPSLDIFVNPSFQEGLPTTVIEALIAGCRVVATDVGWTREILRYAQFTLIAPHSVHALQEGIQQEIERINTWASRSVPASLFSWEQSFREFQEVYITTLK